MKIKALALALALGLLASFVPVTDANASTMMSPGKPEPTEVQTWVIPPQFCLDLLDELRTMADSGRDGEGDDGVLGTIQWGIDWAILVMTYNDANCGSYAGMPRITLL